MLLKFDHVSVNRHCPASQANSKEVPRISPRCLVHDEGTSYKDYLHLQRTQIMSDIYIYVYIFVFIYIYPLF